MFSGMVAAVGTVGSVRPRAGGARIEIVWPDHGDPFVDGESISVSGACLTVVHSSATGFVADLSPETLRRTILARLRPGQRVNLERSLRLGDRVGGHLVLGHVDGVGSVTVMRPAGSFTAMRISLPAALAPEVAEKGSVAVDGVSLTVADAEKGWFEVALIPATLASTTLGERRAGDLVNLETDVLAKYVRRSLGQERSGIEGLLEGLHDAAD
ncbi:MAG: riboflavin synthase [Acidobacteriota bacterium]